MADLAPRILLITALFLSGCATLPEGTKRSDQDPWERYNRTVYQFNDALDQAVLRPTAKGYRAITPDPVEHGIGNFFNNLSYPIVFVNQFLQGDFAEGFLDVGRFLVNSTVGIAGIFDPASEIGLIASNEDFGQTLAVWGVPQGPYFVLPFLGPSSVRDSVGSYADAQINPAFEYIEEPDRYYLLGLRIVDLRAQLLDVDSQLRTTYDPYAFMRDAYLQRREYLVNDGRVPQQDYYDDIYEDFEEFDDFDEATSDDSAEPASAAPAETPPQENDPATNENR